MSSTYPIHLQASALPGVDTVCGMLEQAGENTVVRFPQIRSSASALTLPDKVLPLGKTIARASPTCCLAPASTSKYLLQKTLTNIVSVNLGRENGKREVKLDRKGEGKDT